MMDGRAISLRFVQHKMLWPDCHSFVEPLIISTMLQTSDKWLDRHPPPSNRYRTQLAVDSTCYSSPTICERNVIFKKNEFNPGTSENAVQLTNEETMGPLTAARH